jgi:hypothetical protein
VAIWQPRAIFIDFPNPANFPAVPMMEFAKKNGQIFSRFVVVLNQHPRANLVNVEFGPHDQISPAQQKRKSS